MSDPVIGPPWNDRLARCFHESGHAVIAHSLGVPVTCLTVDQDGSNHSQIGDAALRTQLRIRLAGFIAELRYCERTGNCPVDHRPSLSTSDDNDRAWEVATRLCGGNVDAASALLSDLQATLDTTVVGWWSRIERVAVALSKTSTSSLKGQLLTDLLNGKSRN